MFGSLLIGMNVIEISDIITNLPSYTSITSVFYKNGFIYILSDQRSFSRYDPITNTSQTLISSGYPHSKLSFDGVYFYFIDFHGAVSKTDGLSTPATIDYSLSYSYVPYAIANDNFLFVSANNLLRKYNKSDGAFISEVSELTDEASWVVDNNYIYHSRAGTNKVVKLSTTDLSLISTYSLPNGFISSMTLTPSAIWVTAKPNYLYRINKLSGIVTEFHVSGYSTIYKDVELDIFITYIPEINKLIVSCGDEGVIKYINQNAVNDSDLILKTTTVGDQPMQVTYGGGSLFVANFYSNFLTKIT